MIKSPTPGSKRTPRKRPSDPLQYIRRPAPKRVIPFKGSVITQFREDRMREFGIYFCVEDSTFTIHEIRFPNSGFIGGRFLRPYKAINPDTHKPYTASEVAYGREVVINSWRFRLEDPTDGAMKLTETRPSGPTVYELVNTIKHSIGGRLHKIEAEFAKFDPGGHGVVKRAVALELLTTAGLALSTAEWTLLFAHYKGANAALFPYAELLNDLR